jgi:hypothetical protein
MAADQEGQMVEATGREGQKDTVLDQDRTNDRPGVGSSHDGHGQGANWRDQLKQVADRMRGQEKGPETVREKVQKVVEQVAEKTRGRGMERGR